MVIGIGEVLKYIYEKLFILGWMNSIVIEIFYEKDIKFILLGYLNKYFKLKNLYFL